MRTFRDIELDALNQEALCTPEYRLSPDEDALVEIVYWLRNKKKDLLYAEQ